MKDDSLRMDSIDIATTLLVQEIRVEFGELRQRHIFGQWSAEEAKDISLLKELSENAPIFRNFMVELASNTRSAGGEYHREEEEGYLAMLASILLLKASRNTANRFARMLGLYLHASGVKRRVIEVLDGLGVTEGYHTLAKSKEALSTRSTNIIRQMGRRSDIMVFYDNFNYMQKAHHQLISDHSKMYNYTTAKVVCGGSRVPAGGLRQSMLNRQFILKPEDILRSNDLKNDSIWSDIQRYLIFNAIKRIYPTAVDKIYKGGNVEQRSMPQLEILPCTPRCISRNNSSVTLSPFTNAGLATVPNIFTIFSFCSAPMASSGRMTMMIESGTRHGRICITRLFPNDVFATNIRSLFSYNNHLTQSICSGRGLKP